MGHKFGPQLKCPCGMTWMRHQVLMSDCTRPMSKSLYDPKGLGEFCRIKRVTQKTIGEHCGVTRETVRRVMLERPGVGNEMRTAVIEAAHELLRAKGIEIGEDAG